MVRTFDQIVADADGHNLQPQYAHDQRQAQAQPGQDNTAGSSSSGSIQLSVDGSLGGIVAAWQQAGHDEKMLWLLGFQTLLLFLIWRKV